MKGHLFSKIHAVRRGDIYPSLSRSVCFKNIYHPLLKQFAGFNTIFTLRCLTADLCLNYVHDFEKLKPFSERIAQWNKVLNKASYLQHSMKFTKKNTSLIF
ncbi:hypothetical protein HUJ05_001462 [Dendroctonus ponderosae]|nr:hypothetical protein HUJ05_001462 [Dendroctonus ponderosae]